MGSPFPKKPRDPNAPPIPVGENIDKSNPAAVALDQSRNFMTRMGGRGAKMLSADEGLSEAGKALSTARAEVRPNKSRKKPTLSDVGRALNVARSGPATKKLLGD